MLWRRASRTVLIVSPDQNQSSANTTFLRQPQIRLLNCCPGEHALETACQERPSLIIEELGNGDEAGLDFCIQLRSNPGTCSIPLILLSDKRMKRRAKAARADRLLLKPLAQGELFEEVRKFVPLPKRKHERLKINVRFTFTRAGRNGQAFSRDLSTNGAFINTDWAFELGTRLDIAFYLPGETRQICCQAIVKSRAESGQHDSRSGGFGFQFDGLSEHDIALIESFIDRKVHRSLLHR